MIELLSSQNKNNSPKKNNLIKRINQHLDTLSHQQRIPKKPPLKKETCTLVELKYFFLQRLLNLISHHQPYSDSALQKLVNEFAVKKITTHYAQPGEIHISESMRNLVFQGISSMTKQLYREALELSEVTPSNSI
ncbi:MAG: hypothetical protein CL816_00275 [Coxiellaceae bacterium]|nr:hypothetical protein [Coxiellaceae bacterium]|tara:strand:+ start:7957 stop:8361 length:405 start_codon:yes stop_codon:yes gene_type:complete